MFEEIDQQLEPKPRKEYKKKFPNGRNIKLYNKLYYEKLKTILKCEFCDCPVMQHGLIAHQKTKRCKTIQNSFTNQTK